MMTNAVSRVHAGALAVIELQCPSAAYGMNLQLLYKPLRWW